jgi:hypothetical protein
VVVVDVDVVVVVDVVVAGSVVVVEVPTVVAGAVVAGEVDVTSMVAGGNVSTGSLLSPAGSPTTAPSPDRANRPTIT